MSRDNGRRSRGLLPKPTTPLEICAAALVQTRGDVAQAALENRPAIEVAISALTRAEFSDTCEDLAEILTALDAWRDASAVLLQHTHKPIVPKDFESGDDIN
jgi:hypothetical protein